MWDIEDVENVENECDQPKELEWKNGREKSHIRRSILAHGTGDLKGTRLLSPEASAAKDRGCMTALG